MQARHTGIERHADHVQIVAVARHELPLSDAAHGLNLIANARRLFEIKQFAGFFHTRNQLVQYLLIFARKKQPYVVHLLPVFFFAHQAGNTRPQTAADLILQARARPVAIYAVFALADREQLLQQRQRFAYGVRVGKRPEIFALGVFGAAVHRQTGMGIRTEKISG